MTTASLILRRRARLPLALAGCLALGAHATVAFAATSPETAAATTADAAPDAADRNTAETLDKIEVKGVTKGYATDRSATATKTDTPLQDIPQSISVVTQDLIRDQAMQNMGDVVRYIPGFGMAQGEGNRDAPILRGTASTADFFVDGVRDDVQYFRDLYNVERVEGLKGPNAMIFGRGGSGGLINRVTKQADWNDVGEVSVLLGSWSNRRSTVDFGRALSDDAAFRVTGLYENSDSYRDGTGIERYGVNRRSRSAPAKTRASPWAMNTSRTSASPTAAFPRSAAVRWKPIRRPSSAIRSRVRPGPRSMPSAR